MKGLAGNFSISLPSVLNIHVAEHDFCRVAKGAQSEEVEQVSLADFLQSKCRSRSLFFVSNFRGLFLVSPRF